MKIITLQPQEMSNGVLPYPFFIDKKGLVGRQDFWKGKPYKLLGFSKTSVAGRMDLIFNDFIKKPKLAINMYPVFTDNKHNWTTSFNPIESISTI